MVACDECEYREIVGQNKFCRFHSSYIGRHGCENGKCKPITNADHIRSMSDEELASFFRDYVACDDCPVEPKKCVKGWIPCKDVALSWLKEDVKDE